MVLLSLNTATLIADFERGIGLDSRKGSKALSAKCILDDESAVIKCCDCINNWKNPFEDSDSLFCLFSEIVVCHEVEEDMFNAENIERRRLESFIAERIEANHTDFYATIKKNNLKTFATLKILNNNISTGADRETFARLILIQQRSVSLRGILQYELGPLSLSIANSDGTLRKTNKSKLFKHIHPDIPLCDAAPENSQKIFDGMVLLQKLPPNQTTFGEISDYRLAKIVNGTSRVSFFSTDYYLNQSVKVMEIEKRSI